MNKIIMNNNIENKIGWRVIVVAPLQLVPVQQVTSKRIDPAIIDFSWQFFAHPFATNVAPGTCSRNFWQLSAFGIVDEHVPLTSVPSYTSWQLTQVTQDVGPACVIWKTRF